MQHRQLRAALEEIFGAECVTRALERVEMAQLVLYERRAEFKATVLGFQRLNYREEQIEYATALDEELGVALICALLDQGTRELVAELGLNYL
ncbi:MAG: hypothetical protein AB1505_02995 [Candidatus Latescibacterota bacterium]